MSRMRNNRRNEPHAFVGDEWGLDPSDVSAARCVTNEDCRPNPFATGKKCLNSSQRNVYARDLVDLRFKKKCNEEKYTCTSAGICADGDSTFPSYTEGSDDPNERIRRLNPGESTVTCNTRSDCVGEIANRWQDCDSGGGDVLSCREVPRNTVTCSPNPYTDLYEGSANICTTSQGFTYGRLRN